MMKKMFDAIGLLSFSVLCLLLLTAAFPLKAEIQEAPGRTMAQQSIKSSEKWTTTDHSKHDVLQGPFLSGPEVTQACLSCHSEAATQIHDTIHWTWKDPTTEETTQLGKGGLSVNNF